MPYTLAQIDQFAQDREHWLRRESDLTIALFIRDFRNPLTSEIANHGLARRITTLKHALTKAFQVLPLEEESPSQDALMDATIYLQAFVINVFGAIDNLARIWVMESNLVQPNGHRLRPMQIGLTPDHTIVRASLSQEVQDYLTASDGWFEYLENYRHALAHRIPLYIPPRQLNDAASAEFRRIDDEINKVIADQERYAALRAEQRQLGVFNPLMMHSFGEQARPVFLHPQMICDFATVIEIGEHILRELDILSSSIES